MMHKVGIVCSYCQYRDISLVDEPCSECINVVYDNGEFRICPWPSDKFVPLETDEPEETCDEESYDVISKPSHYCQPDSMECIEEIELFLGWEVAYYFCLGNIWKYRKRCMFKNGKEDVKKSDEYVKMAKKLLEKHNHTGVAGHARALDMIYKPIEKTYYND